MNTDTALIAMSGGVDSSAAALLMKQQGYSCIGCTMQLRDLPREEEASGVTCGSLKDIEDARKIAELLEIPYHVLNLSSDFKEQVIDKFIACYEKALTPNPCIDCNRCMKFGKIYDEAKKLGCSCVVTGHYVRNEQAQDGTWQLKKALDPSKDQSYVLYNLTQEQLAHTRFPLGTMTKSAARDLAEENGMINARKPDSQDICFVPDGDYAQVIRTYTGKTYEPGDFVDKSGKVLGRHKGIIHYTIGQRKGLGIAFSEPLYVLGIDVPTNRVILGSNEDLFTKEAIVEDVNWISGALPGAPLHCSAKVRYRMEDKPCMVYPLEDGKVKLVYDEAQRAITPGQSAVFYDGDIVLGGGVITQVPKN